MHVLTPVHSHLGTESKKNKTKKINLHHGLCGYELEGEAFEAPQSRSPLAGLPGVSLPSIVPPQTSKRGRPSSPHMSA